MPPEPTIERLSRYRRVLAGLAAEGQTHVFSHELAELAHSNGAQVRRDIMLIGHTGSPAKGYAVGDLARAIGKVLDDPATARAVLVGLGNLGRALVDYFSNRGSRFAIAAILDTDESKVGAPYRGCPTFSMERLEEVVAEKKLRLAILTVPAEVAQEAAERLVAAGVTGIVNFAPMTLRLPERVFVEQVDIAAAWEKVGYFARRRRSPRRQGT